MAAAAVTAAKGGWDAPQQTFRQETLQIFVLLLFFFCFSRKSSPIRLFYLAGLGFHSLRI